MLTYFYLQEGSIGHDLVIKPLPHELSPNPEESHPILGICTFEWFDALGWQK